MRGVRLNLLHEHATLPLVVTITSPGPGEGKSFVSANLALALIGLNGFDKAQETIEQGLARGLDSSGFRNRLYLIAFRKGDTAAIERQVAWFADVRLADNRLAGDSLSTTYTSANFANKNVGTAKTVSVSGISLSGTDAANYSPNTTDSTTADITARSLTVTATGVNKVYDGTTAATVTLSDNRVAGDSLTRSYASASFADKNVGTAKSVSVGGIAVSGTDAGNYQLADTTASTGSPAANPASMKGTVPSRKAVAPA